MSLGQRRKMVDQGHPSLSVTRQCALLGVSRSSLYYRPRAVSGDDLFPMRAMDRQYLGTPFYESRRIRVWLEWQGMVVSRKRVQSLMRIMGAAGDLPSTTHQPAGAGASGLPLSVEECPDHPNQPGVGVGHHLPAHGPGLPLPGGNHGLAQPVRGGLAIVQHPGGGLLRRGACGGVGSGQAADVQHRPGAASSPAGISS